MPVLWINSIGMRRPQLSKSGDLRRIFRKLTGALRPAEWKENKLWVLSPLVIPKAKSKVARWINRGLIRLQIAGELRRMGRGPVEYWCFVPNAVDLLPTGTAARETIDHRLETLDQEKVASTVRRPDPNISSESKVCSLLSKVSHATRVVYYGVDDWSKYPGIDTKWVLDCERRLLERADTVFVASRHLETRWRPVAGERVHYMPHGVWHDKFAAAVEPAIKIPNDLEALPSPRIGFYGNMYDWIDFDLLDQIAAERPHWSFVMIGPVYCDVSRLSHRANIHFLGRREPGELPAYCKGFDAALIPYRLSDARMESVNPIKLRELLAAGVPVVASDIPEVRGISKYVKIARTAEEFLAALDATLAAGYDRKAISDERHTDDWPLKVKEIRRIVEGRPETSDSRH